MHLVPGHRAALGTVALPPAVEQSRELKAYYESDGAKFADTLKPLHDDLLEICVPNYSVTVWNSMDAVLAKNS